MVLTRNNPEGRPVAPFGFLDCGFFRHRDRYLLTLEPGICILRKLSTAIGVMTEHRVFLFFLAVLSLSAVLVLGVIGIEEVPEHVDITPVVHSRDLDTRHEGHASGRRRGPGFR